MSNTYRLTDPDGTTIWEGRSDDLDAVEATRLHGLTHLYDVTDEGRWLGDFFHPLSKMAADGEPFIDFRPEHHAPMTTGVVRIQAALSRRISASFQQIRGLVQGRGRWLVEYELQATAVADHQEKVVALRQLVRDLNDAVESYAAAVWERAGRTPR